MTTPKCPKCAKPMDEGFTLDHTHGGQTAAQWVEGPPQYSFWTGLKISGREKRPITTYCCPRCGFLESYAKPSEDAAG
ncbi:PF20097 family protein [Paludisphaera mucosa]|uniref:PF20097 family protein n=1 Tax=Paludisphaera mucosa TaxID=3030827 RepID=A0ABT6FHH9_9BACT|nr:PF20097 family protein [Paludisphaera mucosa]MDG3007043.1 PF20097 family protein [Paludisphaera mucosa]